MVDTLAAKTCTPCKGGIAPLTLQDAERLRGEVPQWELRDAELSIERSFKFRNFGEALNFLQRVGELAETEGHIPTSVSGGDAAADEKDQGPDENDFILAAKIDGLNHRAAT